MTLAFNASAHCRIVFCSQDYNNLCQCESLEDVKLNLQETDYDQFLAQENKVTPAALQDKATKKLVGLALLYPSVLHSAMRLLGLFAISLQYYMLYCLFSRSLYEPAQERHSGDQQSNAFIAAAGCI